MKSFLYWGTCFEPLLKLVSVDSPGVLCVMGLFWPLFSVGSRYQNFSPQGWFSLEVRVAQADVELGIFLPWPAKC